MEAFFRTLTAMLSAMLIARGLKLAVRSTGPRLAKGELPAGVASDRAEAAYWAAENSAAERSCSLARSQFEAAERFRKMADARAARGDLSGRDLRDAVRGARKELRRC